MHLYPGIDQFIFGQISITIEERYNFIKFDRINSILSAKLRNRSKNQIKTIIYICNVKEMYNIYEVYF